jgi:hypothetical protein
MSGSSVCKIGEPLEMVNGLVESSPESHPPRILHSQDPFRDPREVLVRVLNTTRREQKLMKGFSQTFYEPVTLVTPLGVEEPRVRDTSPKLQDMIPPARQNLSDAESQELNELLIEYGVSFATKSDKVYHRRDTG